MFSSPGTLPERVTSYAAHTWPGHTPACPWHLASLCAGPCSPGPPLLGKACSYYPSGSSNPTDLSEFFVYAGYKTSAWQPTASLYLFRPFLCTFYARFHDVLCHHSGCYMRTCRNLFWCLRNLNPSHYQCRDNIFLFFFQVFKILLFHSYDFRPRHGAWHMWGGVPLHSPLTGGTCPTVCGPRQAPGSHRALVSAPLRPALSALAEAKGNTQEPGTIKVKG